MKIRFGTFLYVSVVGAFIVVLLTGFALITKLTVKQMQDQISDITMKVFEQSETSIRHKMRLYEQDIEDLISDSSVEKYLNEEYVHSYQRISNNRRCIELFNSIIGQDSSIFGIFVLDKDNQLLGSTKNRTFHGKTAVCDMVRQEGTQKGWSSSQEWDYFRENQGLAELLKDQTLLVNIQPLYHLGEVSYLILLVKEDVVSEEYQQLLYNDSDIMIVDGRGTVISSNDKTRIGHRSPYPELMQENTRDMGERLRILSYENEEEIIFYKTDINGWNFINSVPMDVYRQTEKRISGIILITGIVMVIFLCLFLKYITRKFAEPVRGLIAGMNEVADENLDVRIEQKSRIIEFGDMNRNFNYMVEQIGDLIRKIERVEEEKRISSIKFLQYQMNPHFLYNTINSVRWMAIAADTPNVADSLLKLVEIIQPILRNPALTWKLGDEIDFVTRYIELLKLRFAWRIEFYQSYGEGLEELDFPRFILQPIIENCFMHSEAADATLKIYIDVHQEADGDLLLKIENTGGGLPEEKVKEINESLSREPQEGERIGMRNVYQRLQLLYHSKAEMKFSCDKNTVVEIRLPVKYLSIS